MLLQKVNIFILNPMPMASTNIQYLTILRGKKVYNKSLKIYDQQVFPDGRPNKYCNMFRCNEHAIERHNEFSFLIWL